MDDTAALFSGLDSIIQRRALKKQLEQQAIERELNRALEKRRLEIEQQRADDTTADRQDVASTRKEELKRQLQRDLYAQDPNNPANQAHAAQLQTAAAQQQHALAQTALAQQQATTLAAKPPTAISAHLQGIDEYNAAFTAALMENQQATQAAQANPQDAAAQAAIMKAQLKLSTLQAYGQQLLKGVKPDKPTSIVKIRRTTKDDSADGGVVEELEVPAGEWNEQHPAWQRFNPKPAAAAPATPMPRSGGVVVIHTQAEFDQLAPGTKFSINGRTGTKK